MEIRIAPQDVQKIIDEKINLAIIEALSADPGKMVEAVVAAALQEKESSYSRDTKLHAAVKAAIREGAQDAVKQWIQANKAAIETAVTKALAKEGGPFIESVAAKIVEGLASSFSVSAHLKVEE